MSVETRVTVDEYVIIISMVMHDKTILDITSSELSDWCYLSFVLIFLHSSPRLLTFRVCKFTVIKYIYSQKLLGEILENLLVLR